MRFKVHEFRLRGRHYILLPKLNHEQMVILQARLGRNSGIHIDTAGLCWAATDPSDTVLPAIPDILSVDKERFPVEDLAEKYFAFSKSKQGTLVRLTNRLERGSSWDALRSSGDCALTPDELYVASFLFESGCGCVGLTDFPEEESTSVRCGTRRYFHVELGKAGDSPLRTLDGKSPRNFYLPRNGLLRLQEGFSLSLGRLQRVFAGLGEWCYFLPS